MTSGPSVIHLLDLAITLQSQRIRSYHHFQLNESIYQTICAQVTQDFNNISKKMNETETLLIESGREDLGRTVRSLQNFEKEKLKLTVNYQITAKKSVVAEGEEEDPVVERQKSEMMKELHHVEDEIVQLIEELKEVKFDLQE
ncbi:hypothetical protein PROFUN_06841 [Planoprotostelium fungivorum]|uniref:Uncharacterized protein n=1 Tax=Planoprotostelium fungivorum TaxID=1890364 RepID=A0A2P6NNF4_9EUKA|nr:hypothetical protein PROFUN_06841 [Planoprotostelium fungivorum]